MATAVLTGVPTTITLCESVTGWSGDTFSLEPDIKVQGTNSVSCAMTNNGSNTIAFATSNAPGGTFSAVNIHIRVWVNLAFVGNIDTQANNGIQISIVHGGGTSLYTVGGSDNYAGGWKQYVVYTGNTPTSGSTPSGTCTSVGLQINTNTKPRNQPANCWVDAWYFGPGFTVTGGTSGDEIDWSHIAALDATNAYGVCTRLDDIYFLAGDINIGSGATATWFKSAQKVQFRDLPVSSTLYGVTFSGSGARINITGGAWGAAGTQNYFVDASDSTMTSFSLTGVQFSKSSGITFANGQTVTNSVFDSCGQVVPSTSSFHNHTFSNYVGTTGALLYPSDDTNIYSLNFVNCDNGVQYTAASDSTSPAFDAFIFDDAAGNFDVNNTSGSAVSISKNNGSNPNSYNTANSVVTFLGASVTTAINVKDIATGNNLQDARVLVYVTDGTNFPFEDTVSISGSGTTATVTHTAHGLSTGDHVIINGSTADEYNGTYQITVTGTNTYTYNTGETVTTGTPGGTIICTFAFISGLTNASGNISDSRVVNADQPIAGRIRKSSSSPYFIQGSITGTVSSTTGFSAVVQLVRDE